MPTFEGVQRVFKEARGALGEILSAFEFWDQEGLDLVLKHTGHKRPFADEPEGGRAFYVLMETSGSNKEHDDEVRPLFLLLFLFTSSPCIRLMAENGSLTDIYGFLGGPSLETFGSARASDRDGDYCRRRPRTGRDPSAGLVVVARDVA